MMTTKGYSDCDVDKYEAWYVSFQVKEAVILQSAVIDPRLKNNPN